jgi:hypothetical protein
MRIMPKVICLTTSILGQRVCEHVASTRLAPNGLGATRMLKVQGDHIHPCRSSYVYRPPLSSPRPRPTHHHQTPHNVTSALFPTDHHRSGHPIHGDRRRRRITLEVAGGDEVLCSRCVGAFPCLFPSTFLKKKAG